MFQGRIQDALDYFRAGGELHRAAGEEGRALADEVSVAQTLVYAGRAAEARELLNGILARSSRATSPSLLSWSHYILGEAFTDTDVERALAAYTTAIAHAGEADCRLFETLARGSSVALACRSGAPAATLDRFDRLFAQQDQVGNELVELWLLRFLVVLLERLDAVDDAMVLAGALLTVQDRYPSFGPYASPVESAVERLRARHGAAATDEALRRGARLTPRDTVAHARRAIRAARSAIPH
ncbi:hypothetical protein PHK61_13625 [Actinomycetospora lutea]|uniref:hypothetical protein n=1 Tax=Actinomycetospora lutea TaxID=663604 RepID=UPI002365FE0D|nr:hypothetical protein [Actinomycetospora lutea]MDD7939460.1 hypothetical protein [Actinomycetospora lutea]